MENQTLDVAGPSVDETVTRVMTALDSVSGIADPEQWLIDAWTGGYNTSTGVQVNEYSALGWPPLWAAVSRIAGHIATMPLRLHRRTGQDQSEIVEDDPRVKLNARPNAWQVGSVLREQIMLHALLHGNGKFYVVRDETGMPIEYVPIIPESSRVLLIRGEKYHWIITPSYWDYTTSHFEPGKSYYLPDKDCVHVQGLGGNGAWGYSVLHVMREMIGLGLAGQKSAGNMFKNMGRPGIVLEAPPGKFRDPKKAKEFLDKFDSSQGGIDQAGKTAMLREGVTAKILPVSNTDAQFLESRVFGRDEAQLVFFLDILIGTNGPYKSITEKNTQYLNNCLNRWIVKWEQEYDCKTLTEAEKEAGELFWKFDVRSLIQGDPNSLADYTGKLRQQGAISGNEVREMHHLPKVDDPALETYSNPNTTSGEPVDEEEGEEPDEEAIDGDDEEDDVGQERALKVARNAVASRLKVLCNAEVAQVTRAAGNQKNFMKWVDKFYAKWSSDVQNVIAELGSNPVMAINYAEGSKQLLSMCNEACDQDQIADVVDGLVSNWGERHAALIETVFKGALSDD